MLPNNDLQVFYIPNPTFYLILLCKYASATLAFKGRLRKPLLSQDFCTYLLNLECSSLDLYSSGSTHQQASVQASLPQKGQFTQYENFASHCQLSSLLLKFCSVGKCLSQSYNSNTPLFKTKEIDEQNKQRMAGVGNHRVTLKKNCVMKPSRVIRENTSIYLCHVVHACSTNL